MFTRLFWRDALERAIKTAAQFMLAALGQDLAGVDLFEVDWQSLVGSGLLGALFSVLTSLATAAVTRRTATLSPASAAASPSP